MPDFELIPHPAHPSATIAAVTVRADRLGRDRLALRYRFAGGLDAVRWPEQAEARFTHELWMHSCCEAFIAGEGDHYREFNLSPSTCYAVYDFNGYRGHMRDADERDLAIRWDRSAGTLEAEAVLPAFADLPIWTVGLTVVVEDRSGAKSFWALAHPSPEPDFHSPASFLARLPA